MDRKETAGSFPAVFLSIAGLHIGLSILGRMDTDPEGGNEVSGNPVGGLLVRLSQLSRLAEQIAAGAMASRFGIFAPILDRLFLEEAFERLLLLVGEEILGGLALGRRRARTRDRWHRFGNRDAAGRNADQGRCQTDRRRRKASGRSDG